VNTRSSSPATATCWNPKLGIAAIGSGGAFAQSAARALLENTDLPRFEIVKKSLTIAGDICIYSNQNHVIEELGSRG